MNSFCFPLVEHTEPSSHMTIWGQRMTFDIRALRGFQPNCRAFWPKEQLRICVNTRSSIHDDIPSIQAIRPTDARSPFRCLPSNPKVRISARFAQTGGQAPTDSCEATIGRKLVNCLASRDSNQISRYYDRNAKYCLQK
jgi:hypothetical protein